MLVVERACGTIGTFNSIGNKQLTINTKIYKTGTDELTKAWDQLIEDGDITISTNNLGTYATLNSTLDGDLVFGAISVTKVKFMFQNQKKLTSLDLSQLNINNATDMDYMFGGCSSLTSITFGSNFNTSNVTNMSTMFNGCSSLTELDVNNFDTSKVTDMSYMFDGCSSLTTLNVSNFDTSNVTKMYSMFNGCSSLLH